MYVEAGIDIAILSEPVARPLGRDLVILPLTETGVRSGNRTFLNFAKSEKFRICSLPDLTPV